MVQILMACVIEAAGPSGNDGCTAPTPWYADADGDGLGASAYTTTACDQPAGYVANADDCADADAAVGSALTWYADADGDGHGNAANTSASCTPAAGQVASADDCDDADAAVSPGGTELCNGIDDDCDGDIDDDDDSVVDQQTFYTDADADGYGSGAVEVCPDNAGALASVDGDCDDLDAAVHPNNSEHCNGTDDDCDGTIDEDGVDPLTWYLDLDADGYGRDDVNIQACAPPDSYSATPGDCDDENDGISPPADEVCDDVDNDCDGAVDLDAIDPTTFFFDDDGDGFGDVAVTFAACDAPPGYVVDATDCDDASATSHPGGVEVCGGADENCDGATDEDSAADAPSWYADVDLDGYGSGAATVACVAPADRVGNADDCDDADDAISPAASEVCDDAIDDDCDGTADDGCGPSGDLTLADADASIEWTSGYNSYNASSLAVGGDLFGTGSETLAAWNPSAPYGVSTVAGLVTGPTAGVIDPTTVPVAGDYSTYIRQVALGDWDGDANADIVFTTTASTTPYLFEGPLTGSVTTLSAADLRPGADDEEMHLLDLTGDGRDDLLTCGQTTRVGTIDLAPYAGSMLYVTSSSGSLGCDAGEDVDGDGIDDIVFNFGVSAYIASGSDAALGMTLDDTTALAFAYVANLTDAILLPDANGDGYADLAISDRTAGIREGAVYLFLGPASAIASGSEDATLTGPAIDSYAGSSIGDADVDGDSVTDMLVGGYQGEVWLQYGPVSGAIDLNSADATFSGFAASSSTLAVAGADLEGTGQDTIAIGDPTGSAGYGALYLFHGGGR